MDDYTWIPAEARDAAATFRRALIGDHHSHSRCVAMIRAIVDHARAVRLRCDASEHLAIVRENGRYDEYDTEALGECVAEQARIVHGLAKFTADVHRRGLPTMPQTAIGERISENCMVVPAMYSGGRDGISRDTTDAGHDLLMTLIVDVDAEASHG